MKETIFPLYFENLNDYGPLFFDDFFLSISSLNDDMYHTLIYQRRGMKVNALVDDDPPVVAEIMGTERKMDYSEMHVGGKAFRILTK